MQYKPLILKNYMANTIVELVGIPLPAPLARARNKFILLFQDTMTAIENERQALLKKHGDLDENGNLQIDPTTGNYKLKDAEAFAKDFEEMTMRTLAIPCNGDELRGTFLAVKQVLSTLETKLSVSEAKVYDDIMEAFEAWTGEPTGKPSADEEGEIEHAG